MSMIKDIKTYLIDNGIEYPIYLSHMPDKEGICLYDYAGQSPDLIAGTETPGLQVVSTYDDYETAITAVNAIASVLRKLGDDINGTGETVKINDILYHRIRPVQSAFSTGKNDNGHSIVKQNFYVTRRL